MLFKQLTDAEMLSYRQWARDNYKPFDDINGVWHPVVQAECVRMNTQVGGPGKEDWIDARHTD